MTKTLYCRLEDFMVHPGASLTPEQWKGLFDGIETTYPGCKLSLRGTIEIEQEISLEEIGHRIKAKERSIKGIEESIEARTLNTQQKIFKLKTEIKELQEFANGRT